MSGVGVACVEAIETAGWQVIIPEGHVCCGRPLYDYGFLDSAQRYLHRVLDVLRPYVREDTPVVGMEPSCLAVFKDELRKMLPHDDDAARLARNAYHFGEFFTTFGIKPPRLEGKALLWGHCHQRATGGVSPDQRTCSSRWACPSTTCRAAAADWPDPGASRQGKYEHLDGLRRAGAAARRCSRPAQDTLVVADGFSLQDSDRGRGHRAARASPGRGAAEGPRRAARPGRAAPPVAARRAARVAAAALPAVTAIGATAAAIASRSGRQRSG